MKTVSLILLLCGIVSARAQAQDGRINGQGTIEFISDAPLEVIKAQSNSLKGVIDTTTNQFAFTVPLRSFEGFNNPLQREHFNENYVESDKYPNSTFVGKIIESVNYLKTDTQFVRAKGDFVFHGEAVNRVIESKIWLENGQLKINSIFLVPLEEHNIRIPKIVYMKIAEEVHVEVQAAFDLN